MTDSPKNKRRKDRGSEKGTIPRTNPQHQSSHLYFPRIHLHNMQLESYYTRAQKPSVVFDTHAQVFRGNIKMG